MGVTVNYYGNQRAVFANQDDGIFSALPITLDENVLTLETYTVNNRKFVKAGSLVKYGTTVKGITPEEYEITDGPVNGRVALEGYVYVEALTEQAALNMSSLPKIVPIPYGKIIFALDKVDGVDVYIKSSGTVWATAVKAENFTVEATDLTATVSAVSKTSDSVVKLTFTFAAATGKTEISGTVKIKAIASAAVVGASGKVTEGLPIVLTVKDGEVCNA